jgi:ubiquinone/menaquinone biosynthesis C-methylase UbiE
MDQHTTAAKNWLDRRYSRKADGRYKAHQPIRGLRTEFSEPNALLRFARTYKLLEWMHALRFESVLDIGGGEGYLAALVRDLFRPPVVHTCDLSVEANLRAAELFGIGGVSADASRLPFADEAYDLVICSEVIEHLSRPALAIGELMRVARNYVIVSTAEFSPLGEIERSLRVLTLDRDYPHAELNWFTPGDFTLLMGDHTVLSSQYRAIGHRLPASDRTREEVERLVVYLSDVTGIDVDQTGVIAIAAKTETPPAAHRLGATAERRVLDRLLDGPQGGIEHDVREVVEPDMVSRLRCVRCGAHLELDEAGASLACVDCDSTYRVTGGVPEMAEAAGEGDSAAREASCAARLAAGDAERHMRIARLMARLHNSKAGRHGAAVHWLAGQGLRMLWLFGRRESMGLKAKRVVSRLWGRKDDAEAASIAGMSGARAETSSPEPAAVPQPRQR